MELTKEIIIEKINQNDTDWFYQVYDKYSYGKTDGKVNVVYDQHWGDGNDYQIALFFNDLNWTVLLDGTYSSWDSPHWSGVSFAKEYTFTETRYRATTLDELRDDRINEVLDNK
jgi:hypothetical protein